MSDLDGRIISKNWTVEGKNRKCRAVVKYMGKRAEPYAYKCTYEIDGDKETMTRLEVEKYLLKLSKGSSSSSKSAASAKPVKKEKTAETKKKIKREVIDEEYWDSEEAEACNGIIIKKEWPVPGSKGKTKLYPGKVTYIGEEERPYCFEVKYEDDEETMCLAEVMSLKKAHSLAAPTSKGTGVKAAKKAAEQPLSVKKAPMKSKVSKK